MRRPGQETTVTMDDASKAAPAAAKRRKTRESDMTREKWRAIEAFETKSRRTVGEDASRLIVEVTPGKRGGEFPLPFGGQMNITSGLFNKKDVVTCCMVSPSNRFKYMPPLQLHEKLLSEIYLFSTSSRSVKNGVFLRLPRQAENTDICDVILMVKSIRNDEWTVGNFQASENGRMVEFEAEGPGIYVVLSSPKTETFDLPIHGTLYNTKLSKQISVRLPKKATDTDMQCKLQIIPLNRGNLPALREDYPRDMDDLVTASDYYDLRPSLSKEFRRPCTVKLPLPPFDDDDGEELPTDDIAVLYEVEGEWHILDVSYKFTKTSVTFDTRVLTRFCVALARPQRRKRLKDIFRHIQDEIYITRGEIIPFIHLADKSWTLWFDIVANRKKEETIAKRVGQGFRKIDQMLFLDYQKQEEKPASPKKSWRTRNKHVPEPEESRKVERYDLDLMEGRIFDLEVGGDIRIAEDDPGSTYTGLQYHERLNESFRRFIVEPHPIGQGKTVTGIIKVFTDAAQDDGTTRRKDVRTFDFDVEPDTVQKWFYVEPEPEPEPEAVPALAPDQQEDASPKPKVPSRPQDKESWLRLITPTKPPRKVTKESRVLSGRSLMALAREVEQGLTLAIYLDLNDSTITGMGFDALAKGQSLIDITYRILMLWKRKSSKLKEGQIDQLVRALEEMGRPDVVEILLAKHTANEELTPECFGHES